MLNGKSKSRAGRSGGGGGGREVEDCPRLVGIVGKPIEAERSGIGLQTVCFLYFGDDCGGDKGRPVIGEGEPGDWGDVGLIVIGGVRGLPPAAILKPQALPSMP